MNRTGVIVVAALAMLPACSRELDVRGAWAPHPIVVDGRGDDWADIDLRATNERISFGVANDATHLYLLLATERLPIVRGIQRRGVTVWLDPSAAREKTLGLRIAGGLGPDDADPVRGPSGRRALDGEAQLPVRAPLGLALVDAGGTARPLPLHSPEGPAIAEGTADYVWTYELAVPLAGGEIALNARPGDTVDIGVELVIPERTGARAPRPRSGFVPVGAGGGEWGTGRDNGEPAAGEWGDRPEPGEDWGGDRSRDHRRFGRLEEPKPTDIWLRVRLAAPAAAAVRIQGPR